jgi:hypothetical protein
VTADLQTPRVAADSREDLGVPLYKSGDAGVTAALSD